MLLRISLGVFGGELKSSSELTGLSGSQPAGTAWLEGEGDQPEHRHGGDEGGAGVGGDAGGEEMGGERSRRMPVGRSERVGGCEDFSGN
jgi:hypothetical protein